MVYMDLVPQTFITSLRKLYGSNADGWIQELPQTLQECVNRFSIRLEAAFENLSWNLLMEAKLRDGTPVVLKLVVLSEELTREISALQDYAACGAVRVIDADENLGAVVMARVNPGTPLSAVSDDTAATEVFSDVLHRLQAAPTTKRYPTLNEHFAALHRYRERFNGVAGALPLQMVDHAAECLADLIPSTKDNVLLHGDLHHDNILRQGEREWVVIDPKGIVGDLHFDVIQYLLNYEDRGGDVDTVLRRRIGIVCGRLGLQPERIAMWGVARGVLEACWAMEDGSEWEPGILISERFEKLLV